jgi:hypothetical protein
VDLGQHSLMQDAADKQTAIRLLPEEDDMARMLDPPEPGPDVVAAPPGGEAFGEWLAGR